MKMRRSIQSFLILSLTFLGNFAFSTTKKTVCSITINSSNEVDQFKKHFSSKDWNFVELVPKTDETQTNNSNQANDKHWLEDSCRPDIQCDILVISGHFSGSFFGKISRDLSLNSIESLSCSDHCSGIFQRPKEVFLFGCNTLASKEKDHRSPQEYLNVLIDEHNFTREQASQMAAFRYSEWGQSFRGRMAGAFAQSPRIYGFSSVAPSGPNIEPAIQHYLKITKGEYSDFSAYNTRLKTQTNMKLMSSLKNFSITQVAGSQALQKTPQPAPYCQLWDKKRSRLERIKYMQLLLDSDQAISNNLFQMCEQAKSLHQKRTLSFYRLVAIKH
ncbi:MAG: hypothetical protein JNL11_19290 [Bdellovibrionaceae bacterium]|nr:hypothetical protein [Pseudobdellovibrionaceae bacterium]